MDEYHQVVLDVNGVRRYTEDLFGPIGERKRARERAKCKPFRYYLERAFPELKPPAIAGQFRGEVHNVALGNDLCLTLGLDGSAPYMSRCEAGKDEQYWSHSYYQDINSYKMCLEFSGKHFRTAICHRLRGDQAWMYVYETRQIWSMPHNQCLAVDATSIATNTTLVMQKCNVASKYQQWRVNLVKYDF
uniref:Ricin B lectin domain-containing protein n=1 Tax=Anopheles atroparvus TaxID=41427 RepID=A0A182JDT4_ANOAO